MDAGELTAEMEPDGEQMNSRSAGVVICCDKEVTFVSPGNVDWRGPVQDVCF